VENRGGDPRARQVAIIRLLAEAQSQKKRASFLTTGSLKAGFSNPTRWQHVRPRMPMQATGQSRTRELVEKLKEKDTAYAGLEKSKHAATERAEEVEALVGTLEVEIRARDDYATRRDRELELAYSSINRMAAAVGGATKAKPAETAKAAKERAAPPATAMIYAPRGETYAEDRDLLPSRSDARARTLRDRLCGARVLRQAHRRLRDVQDSCRPAKAPMLRHNQRIAKVSEIKC
jgi:hypothetical protein